MNESLGLVGVTATVLMLKRFRLPPSISCNDEGQLPPALATCHRTTTLIIASLAARDLDREQLAVLSDRRSRRQRRPRLRRGRDVVSLNVEQPPVLTEDVARVDDSRRFGVEVRHAGDDDFRDSRDPGRAESVDKHSVRDVPEGPLPTPPGSRCTLFDA